jgi:hypothetical protein
VRGGSAHDGNSADGSSGKRGQSTSGLLVRGVTEVIGLSGSSRVRASWI